MNDYLAVCFCVACGIPHYHFIVDVFAFAVGCPVRISRVVEKSTGLRLSDSFLGDRFHKERRNKFISESWEKRTSEYKGVAAENKFANLVKELLSEGEKCD